VSHPTDPVGFARPDDLIGVQRLLQLGIGLASFREVLWQVLVGIAVPIGTDHPDLLAAELPRSACSTPMCS
jgi:hypothetical protein